MSGVVEYADIARDVYKEIQRNHDRGIEGLAFKQYLPAPRYYRTNFLDDRTWVLNLLKRALKRMVQDHVITETDQKPLFLGAHPDFDPSNLDKLPPQVYNWLSACRTEQVLSLETTKHLDALTRFLRTHHMQPGTLTTILDGLDDPGFKTVASNKRPILPPTNDVRGSKVKRQRSSAPGPFRQHDPAPILPPMSQYTSSLQVPFMQAKPYSQSSTTSDDDALLSRVQNLEKIMKQHTSMVESSHSTVSELDDCLAELIGKCTERKEQAKVVAQKVERLEAKLGIQNGIGTPAAASETITTSHNDSFVHEQSVRIISLEKKLKAAEERNLSYQGMVEERFRKMEMRIEQLQKKSTEQQNRTSVVKPSVKPSSVQQNSTIQQNGTPLVATPSVQKNSTTQQNGTPVVKALIEPSPFQNKRIAVEIGSSTPNSSSGQKTKS